MGWRVSVATLALVACSADKPRAIVVPPAAPSPDAGVVTIVERPVPRAIVRQGLFMPGGEGNFLATIPITPTPAELVEPCYAKLLESEPTFAGWMWISLRLGSEQPSQVALLEHSDGTQQKLWTCIIGALSRARAPLWPGPSMFDLYLSFGPE